MLVDAAGAVTVPGRSVAFDDGPHRRVVVVNMYCY